MQLSVTSRAEHSFVRSSAINSIAVSLCSAFDVFCAAMGIRVVVTFGFGASAAWARNQRIPGQRIDSRATARSQSVRSDLSFRGAPHPSKNLMLMDAMSELEIVTSALADDLQPHV